MLIATVIAPASSQVPGAPAQTVDLEVPTRIDRYKVTDFGSSASANDDKTFRAKFRVVKNTGNCCENYLTSSAQGRIFDQGGKWINYTDDNGETWKSVQPIAPLVNGEGTISMAPKGDVLGVQWDPYSGDHLQAYKYDAVNEEWTYLESPLHTPFYDRPWLSVVPGPFTVQGGEVPYIGFLDGYPHTGTLLYTTDGLTYTQASSPYVDSQLEDAVESWIPTKKVPDMDLMQPNTNSPIIPLGGGRALAPPGAVPHLGCLAGYPHTGTRHQTSDGLTCTQASSPYVDSQLEDAVESWIPTKKVPDMDLMQPNTNSPIIPLGGGRALAPPDAFGT